MLYVIMSKKIEKELAEMNRLKRLELEFMFFRSKMDSTLLEKYRAALTDDKVSVRLDPHLQTTTASI